MLFLVGFMAAGKTTVGRLVAARSGRRFVDLDDAIAAAAGEPVAALVARDEPAFRVREAFALADAIAAGGDDIVVATGGGTAAYGDNLARMRAAGFVVALGVDVDEARRRSAGGPRRPLLAAAAALAAERAPIYRTAHAVIDTTARPVDDIVAAVTAAERAWRALPAARRDATIVALADRSYPVVVTDALDGELVRGYLPRRATLITDTDVARHWLAGATDALAIAPGDVIVVAPGEASKSLATYQRVCDELVARGVDRGSAIVALGGGVVGDLAGFVAATLFRGVPVVQLPTTLVAMVDSAIGGKTALDLPAGKNLIGAFHQPRLVACARETLATLPGRDRRAGFGELWKYALLDGDATWRAVEACAAWAVAGGAPPAELAVAIGRAIAYKAAVVGRDEREQTGHRALLNLGHTLGHAIESASGMLHGEAVALGLVAACRVSRALGGDDLEPLVCEAIRRSGLDAAVDPWLTDSVLARITVDKKRVGSTLRFVVVRRVGACEAVDMPVADIQRILRPGFSP